MMPRLQQPWPQSADDQSTEATSATAQRITQVPPRAKGNKAKQAAKPMTQIIEGSEVSEAGSYGTAVDAEAEPDALADEPDAEDVQEAT
eukprot:1915732-Amphidinium_carterae.1